MTTSLFFLMWGLATALALPLLVPFHARGLGGIKAFTAANALAVVSLLAYATSQMLPPGVYVIVSNAAWVSALSLAYIGVRQFFGMRPHIRRAAVLGALFVLAFALMLYGQDDLRGRMLLFSGFTCAAALATGRVIFRQRRRLQTRGVMLYLMLAIFGLAALHALRIAVYTVGGEAPASLLEPSPWGLFFIVCGTVTVPALFLALLLLVQTSLSEQMQAALTFDSLTRAYSRRSILDELDRELRRCKRAGGKLAVLVLDIDHFKSINDRHGHAGGDTALRHYAQVVQRAVRTSDRFGRLGGEEFALLMYDCDPAHALVQAQRVCDALRDAPLFLHGVEVPMTTSGGLAVYQPGDTADGILARADAALYRAKQQGRDRVELAWAGRAPGRAQPAGPAEAAGAAAAGQGVESTA
ncbi:GGDEF domain-containing protein [Achromobacter agilis]|uniref:diguanylate cyclase n=1 Tax=Achromobacter agilis TaxID=1353888 RepID=A0A446CNG1_9BURK|nr:GGDEF domain-containing protein [Achromobacter agilis]SSW69285.1 putative diguanylate cyclase AdrA [Achromobacter agilis]